MDRTTQALQVLRADLTKWLDYLKKNTYSEDVRILQRQGGEFEVVFSWKGPSGHYEELRRAFTRALIADGKQKRACIYARELGREVLERRTA